MGAKKSSRHPKIILGREPSTKNSGGVKKTNNPRKERRNPYVVRNALKECRGRSSVGQVTRKRGEPRKKVAVGHVSEKCRRGIIEFIKIRSRVKDVGGDNRPILTDRGKTIEDHARLTGGKHANEGGGTRAASSGLWEEGRLPPENRECGASRKPGVRNRVDTAP